MAMSESEPPAYTEPLLQSASAENEKAKLPSLSRPTLYRAVIFTLISLLSPLSFGICLGFSNPALEDLSDDLNLSKQQKSLFGSGLTLGAIVGAAAGTILPDLLGRTPTIALSMSPMIAAFGFLNRAQSASVAIASRFVAGVGVGLASLVSAIYIVEIAPASIRGILGSCNQLAVTTGILTIYLVGYFISSFRQLCFVGIVPASFLLIVIACGILPETPRHLLGKGRTDSARKALRRLRGPSENIDEEMKSIQQSLQPETKPSVVQNDHESLEAVARSRQSSSWALKRPPTKSFLQILGVMVLQQCGGINAIIFYSTSIFKMANLQGDDAKLGTIAIGVVQVIVTSIGASVVDRFGRRPLLMAAAGGMASACALMAAAVGPLGGQYTPIVALVLYVAFYSIGMGAIPWILMAELFPKQEHRAVAAAIATNLNWTCAFAVSQSFQALSSWSEPGTFILYGAVNLAGVFFVQFCLPETKGKVLEHALDA